MCSRYTSDNKSKGAILVLHMPLRAWLSYMLTIFLPEKGRLFCVTKSWPMSQWLANENGMESWRGHLRFSLFGAHSIERYAQFSLMWLEYTKKSVRRLSLFGRNISSV